MSSYFVKPQNPLVKRECDAADRRMITVSLTSAGRNLISKIFPDHVVAIVEEFSYLTPEEQKTLGCLCRKPGKQEKPEGGDG